MVLMMLMVLIVLGDARNGVVLPTPFLNSTTFAV